MFVAVVGLVVCGVVGSFAADPVRCCFDKQYSVSLGIVGETLSDDPNSAFFLDGVTYLGYDYYTDRQATYTVLRMPDGSNMTRYKMHDYALRREYTSMNGAQCTYTDMESFEVNRPQCIPDSAQYMGPSTIGYGHNSMKLHTWSFSYQLSENSTSQLILSVTQDHCVPVTESIIGAVEGYPLEETLFFIDYHPGIDRLTNLDPPKNCVAAPATRRNRK